MKLLPLLLALGVLLPLPVQARPVSSDALPRIADARGGGLELDYPSGPTGLFNTAAAGTTWFGGTVWAADSARWEAIPGSIWTFDSGVGSHFDHSDPDVNPFKDPSLHAIMEGWVGIDETYEGESVTQFRRLEQADFSGVVCVGSAAGLGGQFSFWAGLLPEEADAQCYADGQGYGDSWTVRIQKEFLYSGSGSVTLSYDYTSDTEPGFDYSFAYVDTTALGVYFPHVLAVYAGTVSGSASILLQPGTELPSGSGLFRIIFSLESDGAYSDQDGLYPTVCGGFAVDNIQLSGAVVDGPATFESGDDGWSLAPTLPGPGGEWSDIVALSDLPPPSLSCACDISDSVLVFQDLTVGGGGHGLFQDNMAASPWIDLREAGAAGAPGKVIEFNGYFELPLLNYVFVQIRAQWYPSVCVNTGKLITTPFRSDGFVIYFGGVPTCTPPGGIPPSRDFSAVMDVGAEQVRIALGVLSFCRFYSNCTGVGNSTPWFDNVRFGVYGTPGAPFLHAGTIDLPFDSFPENGTLRIDAPGRIDSNNVKGASSPEPYSSLGDTLIVDGGTGGAEVRVQFAVRPGPGIDSVRFNNWITGHQVENVWEGAQWYSARMDTAQLASIAAVYSGAWMTAYHELDPNFTGADTDLDPADMNPKGSLTRLRNDIFPDDLFTPGSRVNIFYKTRYDGSGQPYTGNWHIYPDTSGGSYHEMEVFPASMAADSTWNCVLYVDHFDGRGAQPFIENALSAAITGGSDNFENTPWDRWDVRAPSSQQASLGRPLQTEYGASLPQILGYQSIIWNSGNLNAFNLVQEDANILVPWLTLVAGLENRSLYVSGDGAAYSMTAEAASDPLARSLLEDWMGVAYTCGTVRDPSCPPGSGIQDLVACIQVDPVGGHFTGNSGPNSVVLEGNGCPQLRSFDLIGVAPGAAGLPQGNELYDSGPKGPLTYHSVSNDVTGGPNYRTVFDAASLHYRRDAATCSAPEPGPIADRLQRVLTWFGYAGAGQSCQEQFVNPPCDPELSYVPANLIGTPDGSFLNFMTIYGCFGRVEGATVEIRFTAAADSLIRWGAGQSHPSIFGVTDAFGQVSIPIAAGLCVLPEALGGVVARVFADGILLAEPGFISPDAVNDQGQLPTDPGFVECGGLRVTSADMDFHMASLDTYTECSDFNFSGHIDVGDMTLAQSYYSVYGDPEEIWPDCSALGIDDPVVFHNALLPNAPNPFRSATSIGFTLERESPVTLRIHDVAGRLVRTLVQGPVPAGEHRMLWDGRDDSGRALTPGVYFYRIESPEFTAGRKMLLLR